MADEYDDLSDEEQGIQHFNDDDIGYGGCYGYTGNGVSKFTTVLIDNIFPTASNLSLYASKMSIRFKNICLQQLIKQLGNYEGKILRL